MESKKFCESILSTRHITYTEYNEYGLPSYTAYQVVPLPALEEIVNCPNKMLFENRDKNEALLAGWINPGEFVASQSARITSLSNQICAGIDSDYDKAKAIFEWVASNIEYDWDYYMHKKQTVTMYPEEVLDSKLTVCDGYSRLSQALLQAQGIPAMYIGGAANGFGGWPRDGQTNHGWNAAFIDGEWIYIDSTWGRATYGDESPSGASGFVIEPSRFDEDVLMFSRDHLGETIYADPNTPHYTSSAYSASADDTPSAWAQGETWEAICSGLVPNDLQAAYRNNITREEFCHLMVNLVEKITGKSISAYLSSKGLTASNPFSDTNSTEVAAAYTLGIVNGKSADSFDPNGSISRQEAAAMLTRTAKLLGITSGTGVAFADSGEVSPWASESVAFISGVTDPITGGKVMSGTGNGNFSPWGSYTREQAIMTALRLFHCG